MIFKARRPEWCGIVTLLWAIPLAPALFADTSPWMGSKLATTPGAYESKPPGLPHPTLCKLSGSDGSPLFCTFVDGSIPSTAGLAVDGAGNAYVAGLGVASLPSLVNIPLAPNEIVSVFGSGLGPTTGIATEPGADGLYPFQAGQVQITFDGVPAPLLYVSSGQVTLVTPGALNGKTATQISIHPTLHSRNGGRRFSPGNQRTGIAPGQGSGA
jgi:hypothetical protein